MQIILLSGGSGQRLWPLSNEIRSKQFIQCLQDDQGNLESMVQRTLRQIRKVDSNINISVVTQDVQVNQLSEQCPNDVDIIVEPTRKGTYPAIISACLYLRDIKKVDPKETILVCPIDPYVEYSYYQSILDLSNHVEQGITLLGIDPTYPSEKYGYILPTSKEKVSSVSCFKEKPDKEQAQEYIDQGGLWNAGVFAFPLEYVLKNEEKTYASYIQNYHQLESNSFDVAVIEKEKNLKVVRYHGMWKDIGTWNTFTEALASKAVGEVYMDDTCENTHVINQLDIPVIAMGLKNCVIAMSRQGVLVSDKEQSSYIKPYVDKVQMPIMFAQKSWGNYEVIDISENSLTVKVTLHPGHKMNYHCHQYRDETWTVIEGKGLVTIGDEVKEVMAGDSIDCPRGIYHTVQAITDLKMIEVQIGKDISIEDKIIKK